MYIKNDITYTTFKCSQLVNYGLLLPHLQVGLFWFSIPKQGSFMTNLMNGRQEILRILKRRNTKDIMEKVRVYN